MNQKQNQKQSRKEYQNTGQRITALYERLSREDEAEGESNSIGNQKASFFDISFWSSIALMIDTIWCWQGAGTPSLSAWDAT